MEKDENRWNRWVRVSQRLRNGFQMAMVSCYMMVLFAQPAAAADTMWTRFSTIIADVYGELVGISTIVAVTAAAVALLVRMISRNERAVAEATSWLKRIVVTWIVLNFSTGKCGFWPRTACVTVLSSIYRAFPPLRTA